MIYFRLLNLLQILFTSFYEVPLKPAQSLYYVIAPSSLILVFTLFLTCLIDVILVVNSISFMSCNLNFAQFAYTSFELLCLNCYFSLFTRHVEHLHF